MIVYAQRATSAAAYDTAIITFLSALDTVVVETGSLAAVDWSNVNLLFIGPPGDAYEDHVNVDSLDGYAVHVIVMCRATARNGFGMANSSGGIAGNTINRTVEGASDPKAAFESVSVPRVGNIHRIYNLTVGTVGLYSVDSSSTDYGVCYKQGSNGFDRYFFGAFDLQLAGYAEYKQLLSNYLDPYFYAQVTISGTVKDMEGVFAEKLVRVYLRSNGRLLGEGLSDSVSGEYAITVGLQDPAVDTLYVVGLSDVESENALILDKIVAG